MTPLRLTPANSCLVVIDLQERLMPTIASGERIVTNAALLVQAAALFEVPIALSEHYTKGLGRTVDPVASAIPDGATRIEKTRFSAVVPPVEAWLLAHARPFVVLCGVEAHVCVMQTALDLRARGLFPFLATDAIGAGQLQQVPHALRRMELAGSIPTGCLSIMYEWAGDAQSPLFKPMLALAKRVEALPA